MKQLVHFWDKFIAVRQAQRVDILPASCCARSRKVLARELLIHYVGRMLLLCNPLASFIRMKDKVATWVLRPGTIAPVLALEKSTVINETRILPQAMTSGGTFFRLFFKSLTHKC